MHIITSYFTYALNSSAPLRKSVKKSISQFLKMKTIFRWSQSPFHQSPPLKIFTFSRVWFYRIKIRICIQTFYLGNNRKSNISLLWYFGIYFWCSNSKVVVALKLDSVLYVIQVVYNINKPTCTNHRPTLTRSDIFIICWCDLIDIVLSWILIFCYLNVLT